MPEFTWSTESSQVAPCVHDELMRMLELEVWVGGARVREVRSDALIYRSDRTRRNTPA